LILRAAIPYEVKMLIYKKLLESILEGLAVTGFVFGVVAFVRLEKLIKSLKKKGILDVNYKEN